MMRIFSHLRTSGRAMVTMGNRVDGGAPQQPKQGETAHQGLQLSLEFRGVIIAVVSDHVIPHENFTALEHDVTGMETKDFDVFFVPDGKIVYIPTEEVDVYYQSEQRELVLKGPIHLFGNGSTLAYTAQYMAECLRTSKSGLMLIHAAAVRSPVHQTSYVLLGDKGAGKTTLAFRLCHQYRYQLIGNDHIFLGTRQDGTVVTTGGNAWFHIRKTAVLADPYLAQLLPSSHDDTKSAWNTKMRIVPSQVGVAVDSGETVVKSVFHIRIDHTQSKLHVEDWRGVQRNLILHECFGRHISGQATPLLDDWGNYIGSLPPINLDCACRARDTLVDRVIQTGVVEIFAPDSNSALDFITHLEA